MAYLLQFKIATDSACSFANWPLLKSAT